MPRKIYPPTVRGGRRVHLRKKQFEALEEVGGRPLSREHRAELKALCDDYLISSEFERRAVQPSAVTNVYDNLIKKTGSVIASLAHILGRETPEHHAVHVELEDHLRRINADNAVRAVFDQFSSFQGAVVRARNEHLSDFGGRGRPMKNESLREFIWKLGNLYELAGGRAGVTYKPIDDSLSSPFLAWVVKINEFLPQAIKAKSSALPDMVREICVRNNKRKQKRPAKSRIG